LPTRRATAGASSGLSAGWARRPHACAARRRRRSRRGPSSPVGREPFARLMASGVPRLFAVAASAPDVRCGTRRLLMGAASAAANPPRLVGWGSEPKRREPRTLLVALGSYPAAELQLRRELPVVCSSRRDRKTSSRRLCTSSQGQARDLRRRVRAATFTSRERLRSGEARPEVDTASGVFPASSRLARACLVSLPALARHPLRPAYPRRRRPPASDLRWATP